MGKNRKAQHELGFLYVVNNNLVSTITAPKKHIHQLSKHENFKYIP
jgi:hypothetical protein